MANNKMVNVKKLAVIGAGGHSRVVIEAAKLSGCELLGIIDINYKKKIEKIQDIPIIGGITVLDRLDPKLVSVIVALGDNYEYAIVSEPKRQYLWILSRKPVMGRSKYDKLIKLIEEQHFNVSLLITSQKKDSK